MSDLKPAAEVAREIVTEWGNGPVGWAGRRGLTPGEVETLMLNPLEDAIADALTARDRQVAERVREACAGRLVILARASLGDGRPQREVDSLMELSRIIRALDLEVAGE